MKHTVMLKWTSLLSIFLASIHIVHDINRGTDKPGINQMVGVLILLVWLCGTLLLIERRSGLVIVLLGAILAAGLPVLHWWNGVNAEFVKTTSGFFFMWTLYLVGVTGGFSLVLSVLEFFRLRSARPAVVP